ncbi:hypothetical protein HanRHA438_Chr12g0559381 [Helianthus annuus]|nr:hypothetical protein HanRHA438_Chr12g0559381 [Helianthus annuus]
MFGLFSLVFQSCVELNQFFLSPPPFSSLIKSTSTSSSQLFLSGINSSSTGSTLDDFLNTIASSFNAIIAAETHC